MGAILKMGQIENYVFPTAPHLSASNSNVYPTNINKKHYLFLSSLSASSATLSVQSELFPRSWTHKVCKRTRQRRKKKQSAIGASKTVYRTQCGSSSNFEVSFDQSQLSEAVLKISETFRFISVSFRFRNETLKHLLQTCQLQASWQSLVRRVVKPSSTMNLTP